MYIIAVWKRWADGTEEIDVHHYNTYEDAKGAKEFYEYDLHKDYIYGIVSEYNVEYYMEG